VQRPVPYPFLRIDDEGARFEEVYSEGLEPLPADPPLPHDVAQWLAGKNERRRNFSEGCKKSNEDFFRLPECSNIALVAISSHSLDGKSIDTSWLITALRSIRSMFFQLTPPKNSIFSSTEMDVMNQARAIL